MAQQSNDSSTATPQAPTITTVRPTNDYDAYLAPSITTTTTKITFMTLPGELRNEIYHLYFQSTLTPPSKHRQISTIHPLLPLLSTNKQIRHEASPILWLDYVPKHHWSLGAGRSALSSSSSGSENPHERGIENSHAHKTDIARLRSFTRALRAWNPNGAGVEIMFQTRHLNTLDLERNLAYALLRAGSVLNHDRDAERVDALDREEKRRWEEGHARVRGGGRGFFCGGWACVGGEGAFGVSKGKARIDDDDDGGAGVGVHVTYAYETLDFSWARVLGELARVDWGEVLEVVGGEFFTS